MQQLIIILLDRIICFQTLVFLKSNLPYLLFTFTKNVIVRLFETFGEEVILVKIDGCNYL